MPLRLALIVMGGAAVVVVGVALSETPLAGLLGRWPRYEGLLTLSIYAGSLALGAKVLGGDGKLQAWQWLHRALAGTSLVLAIVSLLESMGLRPLGGAADLRPGATLGNASDQGLVAVLMVAALSVPAITCRDNWRWLLRAGSIAGALTSVLSGSRAALLGLFFVIVFVAVFSSIQRGKRTKATALIASCAVAAVVLATFLIPATRDRLFSSGTVSGRAMLWEQSLAMVRDHLWSGVGSNSFVDLFPDYITTQWAAEIGNTFPPDSPHMVLLQALVVGGLPLLLLLLAALVMVARCSIKSINNASDPVQRGNLVGAFAAISAYATMLLTHFSSPTTTPLALLLCGGLIAIPRKEEPHPWLPRSITNVAESQRFSLATTIAAATAVIVALLVALPATVAEWPMAKGVNAAIQDLPEEADNYFEQALQLRPWDGDTALLAAQAFAGPATDGDPTAATLAIKWAELSLKRTPASSEAGLALAVGQINSGDYEAGKITLDGLIAAAPNNADPYIQRGIAEYGLGNIDASIADLKTATALSPQSDTALNILDQVYLRSGKGEH
ncbi:O-antigen ligase family protein [Arthrobacter sp. Sr24]